MRPFILIAILALSSMAYGLENPFKYNPEKNGPVYEVVGKKCLEGTLNEKASPIRIGALLTRDFFYSDSEEVNRVLDEGGWNLIDLPYHVSGNTEEICANGGKPTSYVVTVRRIEWPRKAGN